MMMLYRLKPFCLGNNQLIVGTIWRINYSVLRSCQPSCLIQRKTFNFTFRRVNCSRFSSKSVTSNEDDDGDFFGIKYFSADDIKGIDGLDEDKKSKLIEKVNEIKQLESLKVSSEGFQRSTTFGKVRLDSENKIDYMGQFENDSKHILVEKRRRYLLELSLAEDEEKAEINKPNRSNLIEEQYFNTITDSKKSEMKSKEISSSPEDDLNFIDYQYFKEVYSPELNADNLPFGQINFHYTPQWDEYNQSLGSFDSHGVNDYRRSPEALIKDLDKISFSGDSPLRSIEEVAHELMLLKESRSSTEEIEETEKIEEKTEKKESPDVPIEDNEAVDVKDIPRTALEYVTQIRQGKLQPEDKAYLAHLEAKYKKLGSDFKMRTVNENKESFDSSGKRNYLEQVPKLNLLRRDELVDLLANRVIFNERDLIAIDKPNGLIVEGAEGNSKYPSLEAILPDLSKALFPKENESIYIVHRLDRDATGVLLLARSLSMVKTLQNLFAERKISKYYWALVRGVPDPPMGIIDIPIESSTVNGVERMYLMPECDVDFNRKMGSTRGAFPAQTHYRILRKHGNACMVELKPEQGIKHQIRVHLGFALRTPILGDAKYSYLDKIAPQKLPDDMLTKLNVRQAKVRNIPLHLHAKLYIIPGIGVNGGNISISAHLPGFFRKNMTSLGLYKRESIIKNPIAF